MGGPYISKTPWILLYIINLIIHRFLHAKVHPRITILPHFDPKFLNYSSKLCQPYHNMYSNHATISWLTYQPTLICPRIPSQHCFTHVGLVGTNLGNHCTIIIDSFLAREHISGNDTLLDGIFGRPVEVIWIQLFQNLWCELEVSRVTGQPG